MLNKGVCKRCIGEWDDFHEKECWRESGDVPCPERYSIMLDFANIDEPPPEWCPYFVEHIVSENL